MDYGGCDWQRNLIWRKAAAEGSRPYVLVADVMQARDEEITTSAPSGGCWQVEVGLSLTLPSGTGAGHHQRRRGSAGAQGRRAHLANWAPYTLAEPVVQVLQQDRAPGWAPARTSPS